MGYCSGNIDVQSDEDNLVAGGSDEELEAAASAKMYAAITFPQVQRSASYLCVVVMMSAGKLEPRHLAAGVLDTEDRGGVTMSPDGQPRGADYSVKNAETVAAGKDVRVRLFTLAPGEVIPWHFHSAIADEFFVLDGELTVETRTPDDYRVLGVGERYRVNARHTRKRRKSTALRAHNQRKPHQSANWGVRFSRFARSGLELIG